jgi:hypothetical protein
LRGIEYFSLHSIRIDEYQHVDIACHDGTLYITTAGLPQTWRPNTTPQRIALFAGNRQKTLPMGN